MANKNFDFYVRFIDPDEVARTTPAQRRERTEGPYSATTVGRALTKFYADVVWAKKDIVVLDVMRGKGQAGPQLVES